MRFSAVGNQRSRGLVSLFAPFEDAIARPVLPGLAVFAVSSVVALDVRVLMPMAFTYLEGPLTGLLVLPDAVFALAMPLLALGLSLSENEQSSSPFVNWFDLVVVLSAKLFGI